MKESTKWNIAAYAFTGIAGCGIVPLFFKYIWPVVNLTPQNFLFVSIAAGLCGIILSMSLFSSLHASEKELEGK